MVAGVVPAGAAGHVHPRELLGAPFGELGGVGQRGLGPLVLGAEELHPADLAPPGRRDVVAAERLGERRPFVQGRRTLLVGAASGVDERAAQRDERPREELAIVDPPCSGDGAAHAVDARLDRAGGERRFPGLELREDLRSSRDARVRQLNAWAAACSAGLGSTPSSRRNISAHDVDPARGASWSPCRTQAAHEEDVGVLVVRVEAGRAPTRGGQRLRPRLARAAPAPPGGGLRPSCPRPGGARSRATSRSLGWSERPGPPEARARARAARRPPSTSRG